MRLSLIFLLLFVLVSCNQQKANKETPEEGQIMIEGHLDNGKNVLVTIDLMEANAFVPVDSVRCDDNGRFRITFPSENMNFYSLKYTEQGYLTLIAEPGDHIIISGNAENLYPYNIDGSKPSKLVGELAHKHNRILDELRDISVESERILGSPDYVEKKQVLNNRFDSIASAFNQYSRRFIKENPDSPAILIALYNQFGPGLPVFDPITDLEIYRYVDSTLYSIFPENEAVRSLHSQLAAAMQKMRNLQGNTSLKKGEKAPDFVLETLDGAKYALSDSRGKYVLLNFWASWSKPSMDEFRSLANQYESLRKKNLSFVMISLDSEHESWEYATRKGGENWINVSDLERWESPVASLYRIDRIPANFFIDPDGRIVEMDIFGEDLKQTIEQYIK